MADIAVYSRPARQTAEEVVRRHLLNGLEGLKTNFLFDEDDAAAALAQGFVAWAAEHMLRRHTAPATSARDLCRLILAATADAQRAARLGGNAA